MHHLGSRRVVRLVVPVVSFALAVSITNSASAAVEGTSNGSASESVNALAEAVAKAAPDGSTAAMQDDWVDVTTDGPAASPVRAAGDIALPQTGDGTLVSRAAGVQIGLPDSLPPATAQVADSGLVVYEAGSADEVSAAVASTEVSASIQLVIPSESKDERFEFDIAGATPQLNDDGSVALLAPQGLASTEADQPEDAGAIGFIDVPWAVDANGAPVPTHFQVHGNTLTQVVDLDAATAFPVVADPDLIFFAKCGAAVALFIAENSAIAGKFWRVFKSRKALISMFKGLKGMKMSTKIRYVASRLGTEASKMSGIQDLVLRCTP